MDTTLLDAATEPIQLPGVQALGELSSRYELLGEVGRGGMGVVYKARHRALDRLVAIKITLPGVSSQQFLREARLAAQIRSPHVVAVHDCEILPDGCPMLVMEWIEGQNLASRLRERGSSLDESEIVPLMRQTAQGMSAAAEQGIIHRDLKPSNILLTATEGWQTPCAKVADFGLARGREGPSDLSAPGFGLMGTPFYMAPEQAENPRGVDTRADVYSYGATFYHVLTGATPFDGETPFVVLFRHKTEPLIPPRTRNPQLSEHLNEILERCLAKSPNDRFSSFHEIEKLLAPAAENASPWLEGTDDRMAAYFQTYQGRREVYLSRREHLSDADVYAFPGGRVLKILAGNIAEQQADALVSSEDGHLTMGETIPNARGVAISLRLAAGPEYVSEARRFVPVRPGRVVVTGAGSLPARFVFHGITLEGSVEKRICPSRDLIAEILGACFYHADTLNVRTMALPLLGTGTGGFSQEVCLDTMFRYLTRMLLRGLTTVREVRLVLFRP